MEFKYPVAPAEGKEYTAEELYGKLAQEDSGYYLLSANGFWHGGVHFSNKQFSEEMPVQAIADGTVIAYRINQKDLLIPDDTVITEESKDKGYKYSSGFCLIRHTYTSPEIKPTTQDLMNQWNDREIELKSLRNARNIEGLDLKENTDYVVALPKGTKLDVISTGSAPVGKYYFTKVKTQQALKGKTKAGKEIDVAIGIELYIATFQSDGSMVIQEKENLFVETDTPEKWQDRLVQLSQEIKSYKDASKTAYEKLPANTKLQLLEASNTEGKPTKAKLLYDINVTPEQEPTILKKDQELWIELFDDKGQVKQEDEKPIVIDTPTATPSLYTFFFYSLYMHLCCYEDYSAKKEDENKEDDKPQVITISAKGLAVRDKHRDEKDSQVVGKITNEATLEVLETKEAEKGVYTYVKGKILTGEVIKDGKVVLKKDDIVWVPIRENKKSYIEDTPKKEAPKGKTRPSYWEGKVTAQVKNKEGIDIFKKTDAGLTKLATINVGNRFTFNSKDVETITHNGKPTLFAECTKIGELTFRAKGEQVDTFWTTVDTKNSIIREQVEPLIFDLVVPCKAEITAGEALGYLGVYETPSPSFGCDVNKKRQVHVEVFTPDPLAVEYLLYNPLKLTDGKQFIRLPKGTGLFDKPEQQSANTANSEGTAQASNSTPESSPIASYTLTQDHVFAIDKVTVEKDADGTEWYLIGAEKHAGRVQKTEKSPEVVNQHEWAKLGFQKVEEINPKADGYLDPKLMPAIFQQIYNKIDTGNEAGDTSKGGDGKLQDAELKEALKNEEIRDQWSKLIAYHPSEWQMDTRALLARFAQLLTNKDAPVEDQEKAQKLLAQETLRINTLTFLEQVAPPIPPMLYHFHPVAFVDYIKTNAVCGDPSCFCVKDPKLKDFFMIHNKIKYTKIDSCNKGSILQKVKIIVLHRTSGGAARGTLNHMTSVGYGAHFVIDNQRGTDGVVHHTISLNKRGSHMGVAQYTETKAKKWGNHNSIAIEVCGYSYTADGKARVGNVKGNHSYWEDITEKQAIAVSCLVKYLIRYFGLTLDDVKCHEDLCAKTKDEGKDVYNAMMKYW